MSITINKGDTVLAEINLSPLAFMSYKRYEPIIESKGFKIASSSIEINSSDKYQLGYKKGSAILDLGIITFALPESEGILRSSFSDYDFILTKINIQKNPPIFIDNNPNPKEPKESKELTNPEGEKELPLEEKDESIPEVNQKIVEQAKKFIGSKEWNKYCSKTSYDGKTKFSWGESKCNLFIYDVCTLSGIEMDLPNEAGRIRKNFIRTKRPYICSQWYNEEVPNFKCIGKGVESLEKCLPGDIITDGKHMGIISGPNLTISASSRCKDRKVVENDFGWREEQKNDVKIFRYDPNYEHLEEQEKEENLNNKKKK